MQRHLSIKLRLFKDREGFTVAEILIAAAVLSLAILAIAGMFPTAYQNVIYGGRITKATNLAGQKMEELKNSSYASLIVSSYNDPNNPIEGIFSRSWKIEDSGLPTGLKRITVTVSWSTTFGPKNVQLMTLIGQ